MFAAYPGCRFRRFTTALVAALVLAIIARAVSERQDLGASEPAKRDELRRDLAAWRQRVGAQMTTTVDGTELAPKRRRQAEEE